MTDATLTTSVKQALRTAVRITQRYAMPGLIVRSNCTFWLWLRDYQPTRMTSVVLVPASASGPSPRRLGTAEPDAVEWGPEVAVPGGASDLIHGPTNRQLDS